MAVCTDRKRGIPYFLIKVCEKIDDDIIDLGNGYKLVVKEDRVEGIGYGGGNDAKMKQLPQVLDAFIHIADRQWSASMLELKDGNQRMLALLEELGVDTNREFTVNGTKFHVGNGKIKEVGNTHFVPAPVYEKALQRYEEALSRQLADW